MAANLFTLLSVVKLFALLLLSLVGTFLNFKNLFFFIYPKNFVNPPIAKRLPKTAQIHLKTIIFLHFLNTDSHNFFNLFLLEVYAN